MTERQAKIMVIVVALLLFICGASLVLYDFMYGEAVVTGAAVTDMPDDSIAPGVLPSAD
ncbi:hypothetical protein HQ545_01020, partial [Candidatus Woesearchaeota archaeon]|nr:hypothetical protein [Candidatus Woesearchaeota archaeon]